MNLITVDKLREILRYEPDTGYFFWKADRSGRAKQEGRAGTITSYGYVRIKLEGRLYMAHRLAWLYQHGEWPVGQVDHINRERADNRIANLREATNAQNQQNSSVRKSNTSGYTGVSWNSDRNKWAAQIMVKGVNIKLGFYKDKVDAAAAYVQAKSIYHIFP